MTKFPPRNYSNPQGDGASSADSSLALLTMCAMRRAFSIVNKWTFAVNIRIVSNMIMNNQVSQTIKTELHRG